MEKKLKKKKCLILIYHLDKYLNLKLNRSEDGIVEECHSADEDGEYDLEAIYRCAEESVPITQYGVCRYHHVPDIRHFFQISSLTHGIRHPNTSSMPCFR